MNWLMVYNCKNNIKKKIKEKTFPVILEKHTNNADIVYP